jgi:hypothetical protein
MKLLLCVICQDVFKLEVGTLRSCKCGAVTGMYKDDGHHSVTNGKGVSLAMDNNYVFSAIAEMNELLEKDAGTSYDNYYNDWPHPVLGTAKRGYWQPAANGGAGAMRFEDWYAGYAVGFLTGILALMAGLAYVAFGGKDD